MSYRVTLRVDNMTEPGNGRIGGESELVVPALGDTVAAAKFLAEDMLLRPYFEGVSKEPSGVEFGHHPRPAEEPTP